ncbi:MAG TPA: ATP-binding cassette domain-containing protein [Hyphomicrobiales bacterium]|nr:ATP-binding cassette domain-containing protein [Hyphomicrobiales bacterium]
MAALDEELPAVSGASSRGRTWRTAAPYLLLLAVALALPLFANDYWAVIASRAAVYWICVAGLNLAVGFGGQLAVGWLALLTIGAYAASILVGRAGMDPFLTFLPVAAIGVVGGALIGATALRLSLFYFAMLTLGFSTIVTQIALAWQSLTGGGIGLPGPAMPAPFNTPWGFYLFCLPLGALCVWMTLNVAASRFGRALLAIRDAEVAAEASGIRKPAVIVTVFAFAGLTATVSGQLFATLQSYITPDAFTFDLTVLLFVAILIGGRGSVLGPLLGTILLTLLPEVASPLVMWAPFLYAFLLLVIVLAVPGGIAELIDFKNRKPLKSGRLILPVPERLPALLDAARSDAAIGVSGLSVSFGAVRAVVDLDLTVPAGQVTGLIGPNGSGKTTTLNAISGYYVPAGGWVAVGGHRLAPGVSSSRAAAGIARTFQTPRLVGEASVIDNAMIGGSTAGRASFVETLLALPRHGREEAHLRARALAALDAVGLADLAEARCDRLQHSEQRFLEIARALMMRPRFLLLDEPAAGLAVGEILRLGALIKELRRLGVGVLLVEHHADLVLDVCDQVNVLNFGRLLAGGTPDAIRQSEEVRSAYLGA